jgi:hypothetical protein
MAHFVSLQAIFMRVFVLIFFFAVMAKYSNSTEQYIPWEADGLSSNLIGLGSLPRPQEPVIRLRPFLHFTPYLFKIIFNIIYPQLDLEIHRFDSGF